LLGWDRGEVNATIGFNMRFAPTGPPTESGQAGETPNREMAKRMRSAGLVSGNIRNYDMALTWCQVLI